jgi:hypothetical protein
MTVAPPLLLYYQMDQPTVIEETQVTREIKAFDYFKPCKCSIHRESYSLLIAEVGALR